MKTLEQVIAHLEWEVNSIAGFELTDIGTLLTEERQEILQFIRDEETEDGFCGCGQHSFPEGK